MKCSLIKIKEYIWKLWRSEAVRGSSPCNEWEMFTWPQILGEEQRDT